MVNPLIKAGPTNTSKAVPDRTPIDPIPEEYGGENLPYRGVEHHGVEPTEKPYSPADWVDGKPVTYDTPKVEQEPIPVRLVSQSGKEYRRFRTFGSLTGTTTLPPVCITGRDEERSRISVQHIVTGATVWISHSPETCNASEGFPLVAGLPWSTDAHDAVFAWADSATALAVYVMIEYAVVK